MGLVRLSIVQPQPAQIFVGNQASRVRLQGRVEPRAEAYPPLSYRWYSSLHAPADAGSPADVALNQADDNPLDMHKALKVGTHILTFTAKDQPEDTPEALQAVAFAGLAGGPPSTANPCIIHVLIAHIINPANGARINRTNSRLEAEAPVAWDATEYQAVNRVRYRWTFMQNNRLIATLSETENLQFVPPAQSGDQPRLRYQGALPPDLAPGEYVLTLHVAYQDEPERADTASINVTVIDR